VVADADRDHLCCIAAEEANVKERLTLRVRQTDEPLPADQLVRSAIRTRTCVRAIYNRGEIRMAPHALYSRHGELFVDGVVLERDGQPPREAKLGTFKLDGLKALASAPIRFDPHSVFDPAAEKYAGVELIARVGDAAGDRERRRAG
jgi:hypothetical protein